jgi:hypothetical protein
MVSPYQVFVDFGEFSSQPVAVQHNTFDFVEPQVLAGFKPVCPGNEYIVLVDGDRIAVRGENTESDGFLFCK